MEPINRRDFIKTSVLTTSVAAAGFSINAVGANERVVLGWMGCGGRGNYLAKEVFLKRDDVEIRYAADPDSRRSGACARMIEAETGTRPEEFQDFRLMLEDPELDGIVSATPDHWHALGTVWACQAGKDVYVEKPASPTVAEGRAMVEAARRYGRVVQLGTQQRSMPVFQRAIDVIRSGRLGTITSASAWVSPNGWGVGRNVEDVPAGLDWDLWLGPAPWEPFSMERYGGFMGNHDYARGGQLTNWGVHLMDIVHWGIGQDQPLNVQAMGTSARGGAGAENFETIDALFEYPGVSVTWEQRFSNDKAGKGLGIMFQGTEGRLLVDRATYKVFPDTLGIEEFIGEPERSWANPDHHNDFFDCVRTRKRPAAEIEQGVRSTIPVLLAGIALKTRRKLNWDAANERFINDDAANRYLSRAYRPPWRLL